MYILCFVKPDGLAGAAVAPNLRTLMKWHAAHPYDVWRIYRVGDGWFAGSPDAWQSIDDVPPIAEVVI